MSSEAYRRWVEAGRPWKPARPIKDLQTWARAHGVKILGTIGDIHHLTSSKPQDHTPFTSTPWPDPLPGYVVTAIDLADTAGLSKAILAGARAGNLPWLKYANLGGKHYDHSDGFKSGTHSSDTHIHLSVRTDHLDTTLGADWINATPAKPSKPEAGHRPPGPDVAFPLPGGHWFGVDDGTGRSHSGHHGRKMKGKPDSAWIKAWAAQLGKRGWKIGKRKTWLSEHGNDGSFGAEYESLVRAFQRDQGLAVDAKLGPDTWNAAFDNPVT